MSYSNSELHDLLERAKPSGGGGGVSALPNGKKMEIRKRLDDLRRGGEGVQSQILKYLWVATFSCGGFGGPPPRKFRNIKYSRSYSRPT